MAAISPDPSVIEDGSEPLSIDRHPPTPCKSFPGSQRHGMIGCEISCRYSLLWSCGIGGDRREIKEGDEKDDEVPCPYQPIPAHAASVFQTS